MPATNRDLFGALVTDPEAAALQGSYQLCGYFRVEPQKVSGTAVLGTGVVGVLWGGRG